MSVQYCRTVLDKYGCMRLLHVLHIKLHKSIYEEIRCVKRESMHSKWRQNICTRSPCQLKVSTVYMTLFFFFPFSFTILVLGVTFILWNKVGRTKWYAKMQIVHDLIVSDINHQVIRKILFFSITSANAFQLLYRWTLHFIN